MKLKIFFITWLLLLVFQLLTTASEVSVSRAMIVAGNFFKESSLNRCMDSSGSKSVQLMFEKKSDGRTLYYVFSLKNKEGFLILAADDCVPPVLGYAFTGNYPGAYTPPAYSNFMLSLEQQIIQAISRNAPPSNETLKRWNHFESSPFLADRGTGSVAPLISTRWGQGCFFNAGCPNDTVAKTAAWKLKSNFNTADWLTLLKTELDASHPLLYSGFNNTGSIQHYFICDGYQGDDFFHFNWGWGGAFDGYFYLNNLIPDTISYSFAQSAIFNLAPSNPPLTSYIMDFENVPDFSLTFNDWTVNDVDKHDTYVIDAHTFPHNGEPMAFLSFNPALVIPSMASYPAIQPHAGQRFGACFSSNPPSNNDWFISPQIQLGTNGSFSFWIKSFDSTYGVDDYIVAVSISDNNPASFTSISGTDTLHTTTSWVKKTFNLNNFNNQKVYVAIHCVSNDHYLMMIDDLEVNPQESSTVVADFSANQTSIKVGDRVDFTDQSSGAPTSWIWTFTGATPATSSQQNPSGIKYNTHGKYPVKLKISNGISMDSITKTAYITVTDFPSSMSLDFESLSDFTLVFDPWTVIDVKGGNTYGINQPSGVPYSFPHTNEPMAYICFNPSKTTPAMTSLLPHSGQKLGCCFSSMPPYNPNNKWLISPKLSLGIYPLIEFWVKTYNVFYGDERYNVAVSVTDLNPSSFIPVNAVPEIAPTTWTKRTYDLSDYTDQDVYIGIQCITDNGFIFMLDDIFITSTVGTGDKKQSDHIDIFPNPAKSRITLKFAESKPLELNIGLINTLGAEIKSWNNISVSGYFTLDISDVPQGMYILRIRNGTKEMIRKVSVFH